MRTEKQLTEKVAIITGGGRGIGRAVALLFAQQGARVVVAGRGEEFLKQVVEIIEDQGGSALAIPTDVSQLDQVEHLVEQTRQVYGRIDILVNNAGQLLAAGIAEADTKAWEQIIQVNLLGTYYCIHAVLPLMRTQGGGHIINISSTAGKRGFPKRGAYCASKFGVSGLSESLAQELQDSSILVSTICPGMVDTEMGRGSRPGADTTNWLKSEDIAEVALFLVTRPPHVLIPEVIVLARALDYFRQ